MNSWALPSERMIIGKLIVNESSQLITGQCFLAVHDCHGQFVILFLLSVCIDTVGDNSKFAQCWSRESSQSVSFCSEKFKVEEYSDTIATVCTCFFL